MGSSAHCPLDDQGYMIMLKSPTHSDGEEVPLKRSGFPALLYLPMFRHEKKSSFDLSDNARETHTRAGHTLKINDRGRTEFAQNDRVITRGAQ